MEAPRKGNHGHMQANHDQVVNVDGHRLKLTNLDKVMYPQTGTTKGDVLHYYAQIARYLIPHAEGRPATRKRWVNGVGTADEPERPFFNKNLDDSAPSWVKHYAIEHSDHTNDYPLINDRATLTWFAQLASLEIHVPQWTFGRGGRQQNPDRLVLDLDPGSGAGLPECVEVAKLARAILRGMGLEPMPVTSGSKGIHLYAALDGTQTSKQINDVAHELARALEADNPDLIVSDMKKSLRGGKVLVDWSQNNANKTTIVPYSLRGRSRPMVATPRTWRELASKDLANLDLDEVLKRMKRRKDPLAVLLDQSAASSLEPAELPSGDRLATYRSMRDPGKTPEPVPAEAPVAAAGRSFVIQEHHASRLHWDFRLEYDGVLVSWALPKGVPTDSKKNHLAVQTEDHPLAYGSFEGTIPKGEYGGGEVTIWDAGEYELEKWRDGKEVIATLFGRSDGGLGGPRKYALIHTGRDGKADNNWLLHLMGSEVEKKRSKSKQSKSAAGRKRPRTHRSEPMTPMLATAGAKTDLDTGDDWAFEMKWDGIRAIVNVDSAGVQLVSRNGNDMTETYPDLVEALADAIDADTVVLDGEIVALNSSSRPDFGLLQTRMGLTKRRDVQKAIRSVPVHLMVFDALEVDGRPLVGDTYDERRKVLEALIKKPGAGPVQMPPAFAGDFDVALDSSKELGLEGLVAKKRSSTYSVGRRSCAWLKIKHERMQEVIVCGWRPGKGNRSGQIGSLLLGVPDDEGTLRYVGRVGTGFTEAGLRELAARLKKSERKTSPLADVPRADATGATWVTPKHVGEVRFTEWTGTGRLRHPVWRGWRPDRSASEVRKE